MGGRCDARNRATTMRHTGAYARDFDQSRGPLRSLIAIDECSCVNVTRADQAQCSLRSTARQSRKLSAVSLQPRRCAVRSPMESETGGKLKKSKSATDEHR